MGALTQLSHLAAGSGNSYARNYHISTNNNLMSMVYPVTTAGTSITFSYDLAGNLTATNTERRMEYDHSHRLRSFVVQTTNAEPSVHAQYLYDAQGNRLKKFVRKLGGNIEVTVYIDGLYEHCYKTSSGATEEKYYLHLMDDKSRIATVRTGAYSDDDAEPVKYVLEDHLGSSTLRLTDQGTEIDREEYYPYGESSLRTFTKKHYRYCGKERDEESGMMYYGARYCVPWICRFTSVDPMAAKTPHINPNAYNNREKQRVAK